MDQKEFLVKLTTANLDVILNEVLPLIQDEFARTTAINSLNRVKETVKLLLDENPDNKSQLSSLWGNIGADLELVEALKNLLMNSADKVSNKEVSEILKTIAEPATLTLAALADNVKPNDEQIKKIWMEFVKTDAFRSLVIDNIEVIVKAIVKNENVESYIVKLIKLIK